MYDNSYGHNTHNGLDTSWAVTFGLLCLALIFYPQVVVAHMCSHTLKSFNAKFYWFVFVALMVILLNSNEYDLIFTYGGISL